MRRAVKNNRAPRRVAELLLAAAVLFVAFFVAPACAIDTLPAWPGTVEAVRSDWNAKAPPASGWVELRLPDDWNTRWPGFDGVVWYRLRWQQPAPFDDVALYLEYLTLAGEIRVNGALVDKDPQLLEPLSRMWNVPRYFRLPPPLLHEGENEILVRVSGFAAYASGLGPVRVGSADAMLGLFDSARIARQRLNLISFGIILSVGLLFLLLWLFRRQETAYGWFAAQQLAWAPIAWNTIATKPWPFASTDTYQAFDMASMLLFGACWTMFVLRFCERRWPRREAMLWSVVLLAAASMFFAPHMHLREVRDLQVVLALVIMFSTDLMFLWFVWPGGRTDQRVLSICALISLVAGTHDALVLFGAIDSNTYYASLSNQLTVIGVATVLAWNFVRNLHRIEGFNHELLQNVEEARTELAATLNRQHELELVHARLGERVNLAHDLHDGLGGMLIGNIAAMEQAPHAQLPSRTVLGMLQELRDDLRLIIDASSAQQHGEHAFADLLAPLRHRMTRLFEAHDIVVHWQVNGLEQVFLGNTQSLDMLRVLQEALTNVLKHADARRVDVELRNDNSALVMEVRDNGKGLPASSNTDEGTGMRSMQARARRLGASLTVASDAGGALVRLHREWPIAATAVAMAVP